ncbi:MAG: pantoate--beta-alanine ligase [Rhodospirillaceae bacterium]
MVEAELSLVIVRDVPALRRQIFSWRAELKTIALVPTMGALHLGHMALVKRAQALADVVAVSIFVNPTQFGPNDDFDMYPREPEADYVLLRDAGVDLLFMPDMSVMYPKGFLTEVSVPGVGEGLCGDHRPGHFNGVATVVSKLLLQCLPDIALFGEKDFQQLILIKRLVADLDIPVEVQGVPTVREDDGLALSSRNAYLSESERAIAPLLNRELMSAAEDIASGADLVARCDQVKSVLLEAGFNDVDYVEARESATLEPLQSSRVEGRLLVAATLGKTRLIDNVQIPR